MAENDQQNAKTRINGKLKLAFACFVLAAAAFPARHYLYDQYKYVSDIHLTDPVVYAQGLVDAGRYKEAQDYITFYRGLPLVSDNEAQALEPILNVVNEKRESLTYRMNQTGKGFFLGESDEDYGKWAEFISELTAVGDVRDLVSAGYLASQNEEIDAFTTSLAAAGLALTASQMWPAKAGVAVIKTAKRVGKVTKPLQESLMRLAKNIVNEADNPAVRRELMEPIAELGRYGKSEGLAGALEVIHRSDSVAALPRTIKVAEGFGKNAANIFRFGGPDVIAATEKAGAQAVLRVSKFGPEAVSALKRFPAEKLLDDIARWAKISALPFFHAIEWIFSLIVSALGTIGSVLGWMGMKLLKKTAVRVVGR